jgi:uncharacterized protein YceH (UPF0502 family)
MTELMLRGKQQLGELRTRASRMVAIESQDELRDALQILLEQGLVRANGPLDRRGIEVDHNLYPPGENRENLSEYHEEPVAAPPVSRPVAAAVSPPERVPAAPPETSRVTTLEAAVQSLRDDLRALRERFDTMADTIDDLRRQLGG